MTEEEIKVEIARLVCSRYMNLRQNTPRHMIVAGFERPDVLDEMESRNLVSASEQRDGYLPTVGTFALLGDENELYQFARSAFERTAYALWNLYRSEGLGDYGAANFATYADQFYPASSPDGMLSLGLYLAREFGILQTMRMSDDHIEIESFRVAELAVRMREPSPLWSERVEACREPSRRFQQVPIEVLHAATYGTPDGIDTLPPNFTEQSFWSLIHPEITAEARARFEVAHYADAVESALKVVAQKVRDRTGITLDGSDLMHTAFSPNRPLLIFRDPTPSTQRAMQQGYMEMFAGAMTGIRNPKAHGIVRLDQRRAIHFLFVASLLAEKIDESENIP
jgi:uncharacterized protein (TIGR02391 family)